MGVQHSLAFRSGSSSGPYRKKNGPVGGLAREETHRLKSVPSTAQECLRLPVADRLPVLVHAAHAACARGAGRGFLFLFLELGHERFRGQHQARDGRCVLQRQTGDLGRVNNAHLHHVAVFAGVRIEAEVFLLGFADLADHHSAFGTGVVSDLAGWLFERALHDACANGFVIVELELLNCVEAADEGCAAAGDDAFLNGCASGVHGVLDASFLFLQLGLGSRANLDDGNAANELGKALLELLLVVVGGGVFDLLADLLDAAFDFGRLAGALDNGRVVLVNGDLLGAAEVFDLHILELDAEILGDGLSAREGGDIFEHGFTAVAKARGLYRSALQRAAELVDHQSGQRFALDFFRDDEERLASLGDAFEQRQQVLHRADFLFVDEDAHVFEHAFHAIRVSNEVGREVTAVKLHAFHDFERGLHGLGLFDGDHAVLAHFLHSFGDDAADLLVIVGGNGADLRDHFALHVLVELLDFLDRDFDGLFNAALESGRAGTGRDGLHAFAEDGLGEHGGSGSAVTGDVGSLGSDFTHHLRAHVLEGIFQFDFLRYGYAVLGDDRRAELLFDYRVAALGAEGILHCIGKSVHAAQDRLAGILTCYNLLRHFSIPPDNFDRTSKTPWDKSTGLKPLQPG